MYFFSLVPFLHYKCTFLNFQLQLQQKCSTWEKQPKKVNMHLSSTRIIQLTCRRLGIAQRQRVEASPIESPTTAETPSLPNAHGFASKNIDERRYSTNHDQRRNPDHENPHWQHHWTQGRHQTSKTWELNIEDIHYVAVPSTSWVASSQCASRRKDAKISFGDTVPLHSPHNQPHVLSSGTKMQALTTGASLQKSKDIGDNGQPPQVQQHSLNKTKIDEQFSADHKIYRKAHTLDKLSAKIQSETARIDLHKTGY